MPRSAGLLRTCRSTLIFCINDKRFVNRVGSLDGAEISKVHYSSLHILLHILIAVDCHYLANMAWSFGHTAAFITFDTYYVHT